MLTYTNICFWCLLIKMWSLPSSEVWLSFFLFPSWDNWGTDESLYSPKVHGRVGIHPQALWLQSGLNAFCQYLFSAHYVPSFAIKASLPAASHLVLPNTTRGRPIAKCHLKNKLAPGWCGSVDLVPTWKPQGRRLDSQSAHMPGLQARSPVWGMWEATTHWCFSPSLSPSLPLSKNK